MGVASADLDGVASADFGGVVFADLGGVAFADLGGVASADLDGVASAEPSLSAEPSTSKGCICGKKVVKGSPCSFSITQYTCRCPCYNTQRACRNECRCKGCSNPFGVKPRIQQKTKIGQKRKKRCS